MLQPEVPITNRPRKADEPLPLDSELPLRKVAPLLKTAPAVPEERYFVLSAMEPGPVQKRLALAVVVSLLAVFFIVSVPLSTLQPWRIEGFVPAYATALFVNDSITAVLLFNQFSILRSRALLAIASAYVFTALVLIQWFLTLPGGLAPMGVLGGLQSSTYLYVLWHAGFSSFVIAYVLLKETDPNKGLWQGSVGAGIGSSVAVCVFVACAAGALFTQADSLLPHLMHRRCPPFPALALCGWFDGAVKHHRAYFALEPAAFGTRSVVDGCYVRLHNGGRSDYLSHPDPLQRRLVCRPGLRAPVGQSCSACSAVRDNNG